MADSVNHPQHYMQAERETIEEMIVLFGLENVIAFCRITAYKYKARAPYKGNMEEDLKKADWYINKAEELSLDLRELRGY